jgi:hypothetical protein
VDSAFTVVRASLARDRAAGLPFDLAWQRALGIARGTDPGPGHRREWEDELVALGGTRTEWRCAYERRAPSPPARRLLSAAAE